MKYLVLLLLVLSTGCVTVERNIKYANLNDYVAKSFAKARAIKYTSDVEGENWQFPLETKKLGTGDCEDKSFYLLYLLSKYDNIESRVVVGYTVPEDPQKSFKDREPMHVWNEVDMAGATYILDPTSGCFKDKSTLEVWYQWDITQDKYIFSAYKHQIRHYINQAKKKGYKKFAEEVEKSFFKASG